MVERIDKLILQNQRETCYGIGKPDVGCPLDSAVLGTTCLPAKVIAATHQFSGDRFGYIDTRQGVTAVGESVTSA